MKVVVVSEFRDKYHFSRVYKAGEILDFADERTKDLLKRKLVVEYEEKPEETEVANAEEDSAKAASEAKAAEVIAKAKRTRKAKTE